MSCNHYCRQGRNCDCGHKIDLTIAIVGIIAFLGFVVLVLETVI